MKRTVTIIISIAVIMFGISPFTVFAEDSAQPGEEVIAQLDEILEQYDLGLSYDDMSELSFTEILRMFRDHLSARMQAPIRIFSSLLLVILFGAVVKSAGSSALSGGADDVYGMVCVMAAVTVVVPQLLAIYGEVLDTVRLSGSFIVVFVPVLTAVSAACGKIGTAGACHFMILAASELIVKLSESWLMPVLSVTASLSVAGSVFHGASVNSLVDLMRKAVTWGISVTMTLFTGFVTLKCSITGKADGAAVRTAKMLVSGFVPIVGGAVSDAYATVKGSFEVISGTVGAAGIAAMSLIIVPLILELLVYRIVMWAGTAAADIFSAEPVSRLLKSFDGGLAIAQSILVCYLVVFVVCSAILMKTFG